MALFKLASVLIILIIFQIISVKGCPARCVANGGLCTFQQPTKCCTPICLAQYGICGKTCAASTSPCVVSNDCCTPLVCEKNVCCLSEGSTCSATSECCSGVCENNVCCSKLLDGSTCSTTSECCSGVCSLNFETNIKVCCSKLLQVGSLCNDNSQCCTRACRTISATEAFCCADLGEACDGTNNFSCCSEAAQCINNICT